MTTLREFVSVPCSVDDLWKFVPKYLETYRREDGELHFPLRLPLEDFGLPETLSVERDVDLHVKLQRDVYNLNDEFGLTWTPTGGGPYPAFTGRLIVWSEGSPKESFIELYGTYEPPLGAMGAAFDTTIGHLMAQRTAHVFLRTLGEGARALRDASQPSKS
ncbi:MAG: hypothetical protein ACXWNK_06780 [Vulcanimicrobiaceae bacterium]